jgi:hypothetical protein
MDEENDRGACHPSFHAIFPWGHPESSPERIKPNAQNMHIFIYYDVQLKNAS